MEERIYLIDLYDIYGCLLDLKARSNFESYYFDNLSLGEISENVGISRNAVHKSLKKIKDELMFYEEKLKLYKKREEINEIIKDCSDEVKEKFDKISW